MPSTWSGLLPWGSVPGLQPGAVLVDLQVGSARYDAETGWSGAIDRAETSRAWVAEPAPSLLASPAWVAGVLAVATVGGAAGGFWLRRRSRQSPKPTRHL